MIGFPCTHCNKPLKVKPELAGKKVKCPGCGQAVLVPGKVSTLPAAGGELPTIAPGEEKSPLGDAQHHTLPPPHLSDVTKDPASPEPEHDSSLTDFLAPPQADDELGRLGDFRILKILGHGGMGVVFMGEDPKLGRKVAIKAMLPHLAQSRTSQQRFLREAKSAATLEHVHIVPIFHVGEDRGAPFIVMPFLKGEPLDKRLQKESKLDTSEVLRIGREVAKALGAAHAAGLVHRDIKPANIWLEAPDSHVKILDFGLARATSQESGLTQQGAIIGTPAYMAPEQGRGENVDARCDLWSLGVVLYRLCTGQMPFKGTDTVATLMDVAMSEPPAPVSLNPDVPRELSELVMKLLEKDASKRCQSAGEVVEEITRIEATPRRAEGRQPPGNSAPPSEESAAARRHPGADAPRLARSRRWPLIAGGLLFLVAGVILLPQIILRITGKDELKAGDKIEGAKWVKVDGTPAPPPVVARHGLQFDGKSSHVMIETLRRSNSALPRTIEAYLISATVNIENKTGVNVAISYRGTAGHMSLMQLKDTWKCVILQPSGGSREITGAPGQARVGVRTHVAGIWDGSECRLFVDGKRVGGENNVHKPLFSPDFHGTVLGAMAKPGFDRCWAGVVTEVRISKGIRYDKDFTPDQRFESDADTIALYHFDEGQGDVLVDSSGNGHHGKIEGAKWVKVSEP